jgi:hypothetical protein
VASLPFVGVCFSVSLWDRITPVVLGIPFNIFWMMGWIVLTSAALSVVYRMEKGR